MATNREKLMSGTGRKKADSSSGPSKRQQRIEAGRRADAYNKSRPAGAPVRTINDEMKSSSSPSTKAKGRTVATGVAAGGGRAGPSRTGTPRTPAASKMANSSRSASPKPSGKSSGKPVSKPAGRSTATAKPTPKASSGSRFGSDLKAWAAKEREGLKADQKKRAMAKSSSKKSSKTDNRPAVDKARGHFAT